MRLFFSKSITIAWTVLLLTAFVPNLPWASADIGKAVATQNDPPSLHGPSSTDVTSPTAIPWTDLGAQASKQSKGRGVSITPSDTGALLETKFQRLAGEVDKNGLYLWSTVKDDPQTRFSVKASGLGRQDDGTKSLEPLGRVETKKDVVRFLRPDLIEEYSVSVDGVRQDFVIAEPPAGQGDLRVELSVTGATAQDSNHGVILVLQGSQRRLAYHRLHVTDARRRELKATLAVDSPGKLAIVVADAGAAYPLCIDPTFSDANWFSMGFGVGTSPGTNGNVYALANDGDGNVYAGGDFTLAGGVVVNRVAKWDGTIWSALGSGMNGTVLALAVDGYGNVYAGGEFIADFQETTTFNHIAKWDGTSWSTLGTGTQGSGPSHTTGYVYALAVFGDDVYAGGFFVTAGGNDAYHIAKWDGTNWSALGDGMDDAVRALAVHWSGDVYAGGYFSTAGGTTVNHVAKWDPTTSTWSAVGAGMDGPVLALVFDGSEYLCAGGEFSNYVAQWNDGSWVPLGSLNGRVTALVGGGDLYAGGDFTQDGATPLTHVARWNGSWNSLGDGVDNAVFALAVRSGYYYVGGAFQNAGGQQVNHVAKWDLEGASWEAMPPAPDTGINAVTTDDEGNVYVGGYFTEAGGVPANNIAKWNGTAWSALGDGLDDTVMCLLTHGTDLYAGGWFNYSGIIALNHIARWDGANWSALGGPPSPGTNNLVNAMAMDGNGHLYAGGSFTTAGGVSASRVAKWDGGNWSALGDGVDDTIDTLVVDGSNNVYAGGWFLNAGGAPAKRVAKWSGGAWSALGSGMNDWVVKALAVDGSGNLYAGGLFTDPVNRIAKWNGSTWTTLGDGVTSGYGEGVNALAVDDAGNVYAGGDFTAAGVVAASNIAKWDIGTDSWEALGSGTDGTVNCLAFKNNRLYVGGGFTQAGAKSAVNAAYADFSGGGVSIKRTNIGKTTMTGSRSPHKGNLK